LTEAALNPWINSDVVLGFNPFFDIISGQYLLIHYNKPWLLLLLKVLFALRCLVMLLLFNRSFKNFFL
jgi:hypothetical protein